MNLEYHVGDIIRKARSMSKVSARRRPGGGVEEADLAALEESGRPR